MKIGHVLGKWLCLCTCKAEPAPPGKASFGELSVSKGSKITFTVETSDVNKAARCKAKAN